MTGKLLTGLRKIIRHLTYCNNSVLNIIKAIYIRVYYYPQFYLRCRELVNKGCTIKIESGDLNEEVRSFLKSILYKAYNGTIRIKNKRTYLKPIAAIVVPKNIESYLKLIGPKSRNMIKKAQNQGISFDVFNWNNYLDDIYEINTSKSFRQGRRMDQGYLAYPERIDYLNLEHKQVHLGAFKQEKLVAYAELNIFGNFCMINRILGHAGYLQYGIMNGLIYYMVDYCIKTGIAEYINYLSMINKKNNPLSAFKYRVGFREYVLYELE